MNGGFQKSVVNDKSIEMAFNNNRGLPFSICMEAAGKDNELLGYLAYAYYKKAKRDYIYVENSEWSKKKKKEEANKYRQRRTKEEYEAYFAKANDCLTVYSNYVIDQNQIKKAIEYFRENGCDELVDTLQELPDRILEKQQNLRYEQCKIVEQALPVKKSKWSKFVESAVFNMLGSLVCFLLIVIGFFLILKIAGVEHYNSVIEKLKIETTKEVQNKTTNKNVCMTLISSNGAENQM